MMTSKELEFLIERVLLEVRGYCKGQNVRFGVIHNTFDVVHLSSADVDVLDMTPRIPSEPWIDDKGIKTEDDFTPRISLARTIDDAMLALAGTDTMMRGDVNVFAGIGVETESTVDDMDLCPRSDGNEYGENFQMTPWLKDVDHDWWASYIKDVEGPATIPDESLSDEFEGCVPDAKRTNELWSRSPVSLPMVGTLSDDKRMVTLTQAGADILNSL